MSHPLISCVSSLKCKWLISLNMLHLLSSIWFSTGEKFRNQRNDSFMVAFPAYMTREKGSFFREGRLEGPFKCLHPTRTLHFLEGRANVKTGGH